MLVAGWRSNGAVAKSTGGWSVSGSVVETKVNGSVTWGQLTQNDPPWFWAPPRFQLSTT